MAAIHQIRSPRCVHRLKPAPGTMLAALIPLLVAVVGFDIYCLEDIARTDQVYYLPRWAWALLCLVVCPWAGMVYLTMGRSH
jgi:hypothetical protein